MSAPKRARSAPSAARPVTILSLSKLGSERPRQHIAVLTLIPCVQCRPVSEVQLLKEEAEKRRLLETMTERERSGFGGANVAFVSSNALHYSASQGSYLREQERLEAKAKQDRRDARRAAEAAAAEAADANDGDGFAGAAAAAAAPKAAKSKKDPLTEVEEEDEEDELDGVTEPAAPNPKHDPLAAGLAEAQRRMKELEMGRRCQVTLDSTSLINNIHFHSTKDQIGRTKVGRGSRRLCIGCVGRSSRT